MQPITEEQFKEALPSALKKSVSTEVMDLINATLSDSVAQEAFRENLLSYTSLLQDGKFKLASYVSAVKFISLKLLGKTNIDAYVATFPDKYAQFLADGISRKDISTYASAFNKTKLVNLIFEQTLIPTHILNAPLFQQALNTQATLMMTAKSEKVRCDAANSLLSHLKPPDTKKIELDLGTKTDKTLDILRATTKELIDQQKELIRQGATAKHIAEGALIVVDSRD